MKRRGLKIGATGVAVLIVLIVVKKVIFPTIPQVNPTTVEWIGDHTVKLATTGQIRAGQELFLTLRQGGQLDQVLAKVGDAVKKDQLLAIVDASKNKAGLERALSRYRFAAAEYSRNQSLLASAAATRQAYDESLNQMNIARTELEEAKQKLEDSIVRSPIDGILTMVAFKIGDFVPDGSRAIVVEDRTAYEVTVRVPMDQEKNLPTQSKVELEPLSKRSTVKITAIDANIESLAALVSSISRDFDARVKFSPLPEGFAVRDQVNVFIPMQSFQGVVALPPQTVFDLQVDPRVLVVNGEHKTEWKPVQIVESTSDKIYVTGLNRDQVVVTPEVGVQPAQIIGKKVKFGTTSKG